MEPREQNHKNPRKICSDSENHAFVLRYRMEPEGPSEAEVRIRIDLEYVNTKQRWRYSALDQALACITEVVDNLKPTLSGSKTGQK